MELEFILLISIFSIAFGLVFVRWIVGPCFRWCESQRKLEAKRREQERLKALGMTPEAELARN